MAFYNNVIAGAAGSGAAVDEGYLIEKSVRFNSNHDSNLSNSFSGMSAGNRSKITFSFWAKFWENDYAILGCGTSQSYYFEIKYTNVGEIEVFGNGLVSTKTTKRFIDNNAWYHICVAIDKGHSQNSEKLIIYVNGIRQTLTANQNSTDVIYWNEAGQHHRIGGRSWSTGNQGNYYLAEFYALENFVPATATDDAAGSVTGFPNASYITDLVEFDANKVVQPKEYTGSYGSRSVYLKFDDASNLGKDSSGNNKHFTVTNMSAETGAAISVASADGALPIVNTTGDQGGTATSGNRTDSNASYLELALPLYGSNNATTFYDNSGNNRTVNNTGVQVKTLESRFYGSSAYFDGNDTLKTANTSNIFDFGTGDFTVELWARPNGTSGDQYVLSWECSGPSAGHAGFNIYNGNWRLGGFNGHLYNGNTGLAAGEWVHLAWTKSSGTHRIFINGQIVSQFGASALNLSATTDLTLGAYAGSNNPHKFVGYMQDLRVYKGVAKYTSSFPIPAEANLTVGANCDHLVDSPTNYTAQNSLNNNSGNYAIMSHNDHESCSISDGGLEFISGSSKCGRSTFWANSGKWYYEFQMTVYGNPYVGIASNGNLANYTAANAIANNNNGNIYYQTNGVHNQYKVSKRLNAVGSYMVAYDLDNGKIWWGKDGTWYATTASTRDQATTKAAVEAGNDAQEFSTHPSFGDFWSPVFGSSTNSCTYKINFGQRPWAYPDSVPEGFQSLCTRNLDEPGVEKPFEHFEVSTWSGDGASSRTIQTDNEPDLVWVKNRHLSGRSNYLYDVVRGFGSQKELVTDSIAKEGSNNHLTNNHGYVSGASSSGFTLAAGATNSTYTNDSGNSYVGFSWDAGTTTDTNASGGTVTPTGLRANPSCGTSIITYTGTGNNLTLPHGLNAVPAMYIVKNRSKSTGFEWGVYHKDLPANAAQNFNYSNNNSVSSTWWNNTRPTSSVINIGTYGAVNQNGGEHVAYVFSEIPGYSKFGSFNSGNDHYLFMGFRPRWVMFKGIASGYDWMILDTIRSGGNYVDDWISSNTNGTEVQNNSTNYFDFFAGGVKIKGTGGYFGGNVQIIYAAFAEHPFKLARAR